MKNRKQGFTLVEIMIVVMIIGLLAAIALPGFARARRSAQTNACINNLRQIESAKDQYAIEGGLVGGAAVSQTGITPFLKAFPVCPVGGTAAYTGTLGTVIGEGTTGTLASCSSYNATNHPATIGNP